MKFSRDIMRVLSALLCLLMLFSATPELWGSVVAAAEISSVEELANDIPDGVEDATISADLVLTEDTAYKNLEITAGTVDLNGYMLTVYGNLKQTAEKSGANCGDVKVNGGELVVHGDYTISSGYSGTLYMQDESDYVLVYGDFSYTSRGCAYYPDAFSAGTLEVKGDFTSNSYSSDQCFEAIGDHTTILSGEKVQCVNLGDNARFSTLVLTKDFDLGYEFEGLRYETLSYSAETDSHQDSVFSNLVSFDPNTQVAFHIYSRFDAKRGVVGAKVTLGGVTKETDRYGLVVFDKPDADRVIITVSAQNYRDYEDLNYYINADTGCNYISMIPVSVRSYLIRATCNEYDVLTSTVRLDCSSNQPVYITASADSEYRITEYQLVQGDTVLASNPLGVFVMNTNEFTPKEQVAIRVKNAAGTVYTFGININVYDSNAKGDAVPLIDTIKFGEKLVVTLDEDIPVVGGLTVEVDEIDCPVSVILEEDRLKIGLNVPAYSKKTIKEPLKEYIKKEALADLNSEDGGDIFKESLKLGFAGYLEFVFNENGDILEIESVAYMTVSYKGQYDFSTVIGVVPVTLGVSVSATGEVEVKILGIDYENSQFIFPEIGWEISGEITLNAGLGTASMSVGAYGSLKTVLSGELLPEFSLEKWILSGEVGVYGKVAVFEGKWPLWETGVAQVYPVYSGVEPVVTLMNAKCLYTPDEYKLISCAASLSSSLESYAIENGWVLDADAYTYAEPSVVSAGDTTVMVYVDYDATRPVANEQVLVYRVYDNKTSTWGEAIPVDTNQTADSEFSLYSDGSTIYLIYTEAREQLQADIDIYSFPEKIEVAFAIFDSEAGTFTTPTRLTNNSVFETLPSISVIEDITTVTWIENTENDIFCANKANAVVMGQDIDGTWINTRLVANLPTVTDLAVGKLDGQCFVSYVVDADCDLTTQEDKQIFVLNAETKQSLSCAENDLYSELNFAIIEGEGCVVWCADNNLYYSAVKQGTVTTNSLFDEPIEGLDNYRVCFGENGKAVVLFLQNGENCRTVWGIFGNSIANLWGTPIELTDNENYINAFDAFFDNGVLSTIYTEATVTTTEDSFETASKLTFVKLENKSDVAITDIQVNYAEVIPGADTTIKVTVRNNGFDPVTTFVLTLTDKDGNAVAIKQFSEVIQSGSSTEVEMAFIAPAASLEQYTMAISLDTGTDAITDNDELQFDLWKCDYSVFAKQIIIGADNYISVTVRNDGYLASAGTLELIDSSGNVIARKPIKLLTCDGAEEILIDLNEESLAIVDSGLYTVRAVPTASDVIASNNDASIYLVEIDVGNGIEILCNHSYGVWITEEGSTPTTTGMKYRICAICGNKETEEIKAIAQLAFSGASLSLQHNLAINYKVDKALFEDTGYTDPYVVFELNGVRTKISNYTISGERYVFTFRNIAPNQMNDVIYATLYATYDGVEYASETREYSVAEYCYSMLEQYSADEYAELRTLLVDLLNYGAASQVYTDYKTDTLVNASLTDAQLQWGTNEDPALDTVLNTAYSKVDNPTAVWKGAGLSLQESVSMRFKFTAESIEGLTVKIESGSSTWTITSDKFQEEDGVYYVYFSGLDAGMMRQSVYLTIYNGDMPVSNTVCYSIESYAYEKQGSTIAGLADLVKAMMRYGDSAYAYVN